MSKALAKKNDLHLAIEKLDDIVSDYSIAALHDVKGKFERALKIASGIQRIRNALTAEVMQHVMQLKGSKLGFKTDEESRGQDYPLDVVKDCLIEAVLRGANPALNEFNIIAGNAYMTREFFERVCREFPGVKNLRPKCSVPKLKEGRTVVTFTATWELNGKKDEHEQEFPIKVNKAMGDDAILGKAMRKGLAKVYAIMSGQDQYPDGDATELKQASGEVVAEEEESNEADEQKDRLKAKVTDDNVPKNADLIAMVEDVRANAMKVKGVKRRDHVRDAWELLSVDHQTLVEGHLDEPLNDMISTDKGCYSILNAIIEVLRAE